MIASRVPSPTEQSDPRTADIDTAPTGELLRLLHTADREVPEAVAAALAELERLVDAVVPRLRAGGRVHYFGAGTSGRLALLDAAELPPTFGIEEGRFVAHLAGGSGALRHAVEGAEDDVEAGARDAAGAGADDAAVGVSASGTTPYVAGALAQARTAGAVTALITSNPAAPLAEHADHVLLTPTGAEAITGSTRLKAGSAQKMVLNLFSTAAMVRLGRTYGNLMIDMRVSNAKLRERSVQMLQQATGNDADSCRDALVRCGEARSALLSMLSGADATRCALALAAAGGNVRDALTQLRSDAGR